MLQCGTRGIARKTTLIAQALVDFSTMWDKSSPNLDACGAIMTCPIWVRGVFLAACLGLAGCGVSSTVPLPASIEMPDGLLSKQEREAAISDLTQGAEKRQADATRRIEQSQ